ncbi:MAG: N-acetylmuramic acid 6-phosphate etherase [Phycisphaerales bacterium]
MHEPPLPPDRSHVATERRHPRSLALDTLDTPAIVALMVDDHRRVLDAVLAATEELASFIDDLVPRVRAGGRLVYIGAGTSGRLGVLDASECPPTFQSDPAQVVGIVAGGDAALRRSSEGAEDDPRGADAELARLAVGPGDTLLGIAAGGTTPYVLGALGFARGRGAATALLTCAPHAAWEPAAALACDRVIVMDTGPEILTGSTRLKAGTATKLALNIVTTALFTRLGKVHENLMVDLRATNAKLLDRAIRTLCALRPGLSRAAAATALAEAGGSVKVAAVMLAKGCSSADARTRLDRAAGRLRDAMR